jgi:hypothetical protein
MTTETPNPNPAANAENAVPSLDSIAAKMDAMKAMTLRNQMRATEPTETGATEESVSPVAPQAEPEVATLEETEAQGTEQAPAQEEPVSEAAETETSAEELIDFIEFAETNPNAKFKFVRNGKDVIIDAKKAAAILGQGGAIHEEARQLKIQKAEFDEYMADARSRQEGLALAMEFTVQPRLRQAYDEIVKTQSYQTTFQQQLAQTQDPAVRARIQASMQQNERYIQQQTEMIGSLKPQVDQFRQVRAQQVQEVLEHSRKNFTDKELKNEYVYNELREKVAKLWPSHKNEIVPGIRNLDLISSDEVLLGLVRDGLKFRDKPRTQQAGSSVATLTRKGNSNNAATRAGEDSIQRLREQAKGSGKEAIRAADNLLVAQLQKLRAARTGR